MTVVGRASRQLQTIGWLNALFAERGIDCWLFGGWAVDFHAGRVTRHHDDVDLAVWQSDLIVSADCLRRTDGPMPLSRASRATPATSVTTSGWSSLPRP